MLRIQVLGFNLSNVVHFSIYLRLGSRFGVNIFGGRAYVQPASRPGSTTMHEVRKSGTGKKSDAQVLKQKASNPFV